jgi:hypothetical protein
VASGIGSSSAACAVPSLPRQVHAAHRIDEGRASAALAGEQEAAGAGAAVGDRQQLRPQCGQVLGHARALGIAVSAVAGRAQRLARLLPLLAGVAERALGVRLASTARASASWRPIAASASSARAAAAGSSLARATRLPLVSCSCAWLSSRCRCCSRSTSSARSTTLAPTCVSMRHGRGPSGRGAIIWRRAKGGCGHCARAVNNARRRAPGGIRPVNRGRFSAPSPPAASRSRSAGTP